MSSGRKQLGRRGAAAPLLILVLALLGVGHAAAAVVRRPLPASDYSLRPLCGEPAPGQAGCLSLELVPQTKAAKEHATPIGMTVHREVEPRSAASGSFGLRPQDLQSGYGLPTTAVAPQTIAIVDAYDDPTAEEDLAHYSQEFGLPECTHANGCFTKVNQAGSESPLPAYNSGWAGEIALDLEAAHAVCRNCKIILLEANTPSTANLEVAVNTAVSMGATEVSNSYGGPEPASEGSGYNHPGVVITASTGDDGYLNWSSSTLGFVGHPNYPASSPRVIAVGGTRLSLDAGARVSERVWNDGSTLGADSGAEGSGCSEHQSAQSWQTAVSDWAAVGCAGDKRAAADVAAVGDPYTGFAVYRDGSWSTVGGTSLSAPVIAAVYALAGGSGGVTYPAQTLYGHLGGPALFDVTEGSNGKCTKAFDGTNQTAGCTTEEEELDCASKLICKAAAGYDGPTGVGTPVGAAAFAPPAPAVTGVSSAGGGLGTSVTITGEHLKGVVAVKFGAAVAGSVVETSPTSLTVTAPGHDPGTVDVTVTTGGGTSTATAADQFTYLAKPAIGSVEPARGPAVGGATVTIKGERLGGASAVAFGGVAASSINAISATELTATSPAHAEGQVDVTVTTPEGTSAATALDRYSYIAAPAVTAVEPGVGSVSGGATVTIKGTHLGEASAVRFGAAAAANVVEVSATELRATSPAHAEGQVDVTITTPGGPSATSAADHFEYLLLPVVQGIAPAQGPTGGGTNVTITGHDLGGATAVKFGGASGTALSVVSPTELTVTSPAHAAAEVDVTVTTPVGTSNLEAADRFTYVAAPVGKSPPPSIEGFAMEGRTLSAVHGGWENAPTSYVFQWLRCDSGGNACGPIGGATAQTYTLAAADVGQTVRVEETASNAGGQAAATSAFKGPVVARTSQSFTWTGATARSSGATADDWTTGTNWEGGIAPTEAGDISTLMLPSLAANPACGSTVTAACYQSENTIAGIGIEKISVNDRFGYIFYDKPFTLGAGGIEAFSSGTEPNSFVPSFRMPITLGADQTWSVEGTGELLGIGGLELEQSISGESHSLHLELSKRAAVVTVESPDDEVGPVTITGSDSTKTGAEALKNGIFGLALSATTEFPQLNAGDGNPVHVKDVAMSGAGSVGPLTVEGGALMPGGIPNLSAEGFGSLSVHGPVTLDSATVTYFKYGAGTIPGESFSQVKATGTVDLGGSKLIILGEATPCMSLPAGSELELVSTTGELVGTYDGVPDGKVVGGGCSEPFPVLRINYTAHSVDATSLGPIPFNLSAPTIIGSAIDEQTLTAFPGAWQNHPTSDTFRWFRCDVGGSNCAAVSGATGNTYTLTSADAGDTIRVEDTAHNAAGEVSATSAPKGPVVLPLPQNIGPPQISGSMVEGQTIGVSQGSWSHGATYTYQWRRCAVGGSCADVSGATGQTYSLTSADVGNRMNAVVTAHNATGQTAATASAVSTVVPVPPVNTAVPTISGSMVEGQIISATNGTWEHNPSSYTYQWLRCDSSGNGCLSIGGAVGSIYFLAAADVGSRLEIRVTAYNAGGEAGATSSPTPVILQPAPTHFGLPPSISGVPVEGNVLTEAAGSGSWQNNPTITYQWLDCDAVGSNCSPISGATGQSHTLTYADVGHALRVEEVGTNGGGHSSVTSSYTGVVTPLPPTSIGAPAISGSAVEGRTLAAGQGSWTHNPYSFSYKWLRCDSGGSNCSAISGAAEQSYTLTAEDLGHTVEVEVSATNAGGAGSATSSHTQVVVPLPPSNSGAPTVGGSAVEGQTLSASNGSWTHSPTSYDYQWLRCDSSGNSCSPISGATSSQYALGGADIGHEIEVEVTAINAGGHGSAVSTATAPVQAKPSGGGGSGPSEPPKPGTAVAGASAKVKGTSATLALRCTGAGPCSGMVVLSAVAAAGGGHGKRHQAHPKRAVSIGSANFSIPAGGSETLSVHLSGSGVGMLRKAGKKGLEVKLSGTGVLGRTVELKK